MAGRLKGKVAFVTAGRTGHRNARSPRPSPPEGAKVIATDLDIKNYPASKSRRKSHSMFRSTLWPVDALAKQVEKEFGPIDILANCAGFVHHGSCWNVPSRIGIFRSTST